MDHNRKIGRQRKRRRNRVRKGITGTADRPRLSVKRTHKHLYCQLIDDAVGKTLLSASTQDKDIRSSIKSGGNKDAAAAVGKAVAEKAAAAGVKQICFDRGQYKYHGRVAALADAVREGGLTF